MAATGGGGGARQRPVRKYQKRNNKTGKQSTRAGCDGSRRRWWQFEATACEKYQNRKQENNQLELA